MSGLDCDLKACPSDDSMASISFRHGSAGECYDSAGAGFGRIYDNLRKMSADPVLGWYEQV